MSPEPQRPKSLILDNLQGLLGHLPGVPGGGVSPGTRSTDQSPMKFVFVPEVEEIRVSPIISKRGSLNILEQKNKVRTYEYLAPI